MPQDLDSLLIRVYTTLNGEADCTTEDITCDPLLRHRFLDMLRVICPEITEVIALRRLTYLRKRSRLPRVRRTKQALG
jgi:hypothetical protein